MMEYSRKLAHGSIDQALYLCLYLMNVRETLHGETVCVKNDYYYGVSLHKASTHVPSGTLLLSNLLQHINDPLILGLDTKVFSQDGNRNINHCFPSQ